MSKPLFAISAIPFAMISSNLILIPIFPTIKQYLGLTSVQLSFFFTSFSIAEAAALLAFGFLSDRYGRKRIMIPAILLFGLGGLIAGIAVLLYSFPLLILGRILQGLGAAGTVPMAMALIGDLYKGSEGGKAMGVMEASGGLAKVISPMLGSLITLISWNLTFFLIPMISLALSALLWFVIKQQQVNSPVSMFEYLQQMKNILKSKGMLLVSSMIIGTLGTCLLLGIPFYLTFELENQYKISGVSKGAFLAFPLLGMVIASFLSGIKVKRHDRYLQKGVIVGLFLVVCSQTGLVLIEELYSTLLLLSLACFGLGTFLPCINTYIIKMCGAAQRGMIVSLYGCFRCLGIALTMPILSVSMKGSHVLLFLSSAGICLMAFIFVLFATNVKRMFLGLPNGEMVD